MVGVQNVNGTSMYKLMKIIFNLILRELIFKKGKISWYEYTCYEIFCIQHCDYYSFIPSIAKKQWRVNLYYQITIMQVLQSCNNVSLTKPHRQT